MRELKKFKRIFRGGSIPTEVELTDGTSCILKMRGAGNGVESLFNEFVVNSMGSAIGCSVPKVFPVAVGEDFPWEFGTDEFDDILQKSGGVNLGIEMIPEAHQVPAAELMGLPHEFLSRMVAIDIFFNNLDRTLQSENILRDAGQNYWIVDHGGCFFMKEPTRKTLHEKHFLAGQESEFQNDGYLGELTNPYLIQQTVSEIPIEWLIELQLNRHQVSQALTVRANYF